MLVRAMPYISSEAMFARTTQLLKDLSIDLTCVTPPKPVIWRDTGRPMLLFGPVERPDFVIDESDLPY